MNIKIAETDAEIARCFPVLVQLRPHLNADEFPEQIRREITRGGYKLAFLEDHGLVCSVAGYRFLESLAWGRFLYVDDLVTDEAMRSKGYGDSIFDWLVEQAVIKNCARVELDSGVQRFEAHRFYLRKRMHITSHHFSLSLNPEV